MSRADLAAKLKVSRVTIWRWEEGRQFPDEKLLPEVAKLIDVPEPVLLGYEVRQ